VHSPAQLLPVRLRNDRFAPTAVIRYLGIALDDALVINEQI